MPTVNKFNRAVKFLKMNETYPRILTAIGLLIFPFNLSVGVLVVAFGSVIVYLQFLSWLGGKGK